MEPGRELDLADGEIAANVDFTLPRMSVIAGRVTDELGEPIEGAAVFALQMQYWQGRRRIAPATQMKQTDDAGEYRITGLMPGAYWIVATLRETWSVTESGKPQQFGYSQTYAPGTTNIDHATRITVGIGQQVRAPDFSLVPGRAARVAGFALDGRGRPLVGGNVSISQETTGPGGGFFTGVASGTIGPDGAFAIANVPPGEYKIRAHSGPNREPGSRSEIVTQALIVDGQDMDGLQLTTTAGWSVRGRIRTDTGEAPSFARSGVRLLPTLISPDLEPRTASMFPDSQIHEDWTFTLTNIFGPSRLLVTLPQGWSVQSVLHGTRDISDAALDLNSGEEMTDVEVVVTNRLTRLSGRVTDEKGIAVGNATVLLFAQHADKWFDRSRWIRAVRPDGQGSFRIEGLPPGEYLTVALDYVQEGVWNDREFLAPLVDRAQRIVLTADRPTVLPLTVINSVP
jgi:hypothetical protein